MASYLRSPMEPAIQAIEHSRNDCTLVIMAKAPKPGLVKTRLTRNLPLRAVTALYRCLLGDTMALARSLGGVDVAIMCPGPDIEELTRLAGDAMQVVAQKGEGLAAGLTSVFERFAAGRQRVVAFNSDSPHLPASVLENAFNVLAAHDVVVGPTHDGGYYLVGAKAVHPTLFEGDGIGTTNALEALLRRARALELSTVFTDTFYDVDVADDLVRLAGELKLAPARAPRTAAWLAEWGQAVAQLRPRIGDL
jgi:rSAM/selenodomain-associated transferase 1